MRTKKELTEEKLTKKDIAKAKKMTKKEKEKLEIAKRKERKELVRQDKKAILLQKLEANKGLIYAACRDMGICAREYYNLCEKDEEFRQAALEIIQRQVDHVESKLFDLIDKGDTTAIIYYLKSKAKDRGYGEKLLSVEHEDKEKHFKIEIG